MQASKKTILVVENDFLLRRTICEALERAGFRTNAAASGQEAKQTLRQDRADLVLTRMTSPKEFAPVPIFVFATSAAEAAVAAGGAVMPVLTGGQDGLGPLIESVRLRLGEPATA